MKIFSIYDSKAEAYLNPVFYGTEAEATRAFQLAVTDPQHPFFRTPADYTLFYLGAFDSNTAHITLLEPKYAMNNGLELVGNPDISTYRVADDLKIVKGDNHDA